MEPKIWPCLISEVLFLFCISLLSLEFLTETTKKKSDESYLWVIFYLCSDLLDFCFSSLKSFFLFECQNLILNGHFDFFVSSKRMKWKLKNDQLTRQPIDGGHSNGLALAIVQLRFNCLTPGSVRYVHRPRCKHLVRQRGMLSFSTIGFMNNHDDKILVFSNQNRVQRDWQHCNYLLTVIEQIDYDNYCHLILLISNCNKKERTDFVVVLQYKHNFILKVLKLGIMNCAT